MAQPQGPQGQPKQQTGAAKQAQTMAPDLRGPQPPPTEQPGAVTPDIRSAPPRPEAEPGPQTSPEPSPEEKAIQAAKEKGGGVFRMMKSIVGMPDPPAIVSEKDFPKGADFDRHIREGNIEPIGEFKARKGRPASAEQLDDLESFHNAMTDFDEHVRQKFGDVFDRLSENNMRTEALEKALTELTKRVEALEAGKAS